MNTLARWWHRWAQGTVRHAWGLAPQDGDWVLMGLSRQSADLVKVQTLVTWAPSTAADPSDLTGLSQHLLQHGHAGSGAHLRLNMALPSAMVQEGFIDFPVALPKEDWPEEVQLEVAEALQVAPQEVNFDFEPDPYTDGLVQRVHWVGCTQAQLLAFKSCTRAAGWRLAAVEIENEAALRGLRALRGGSVSLLTQAPQDWQFHLDLLTASPGDGQTDLCDESEETVGQALEQIMQTRGGARLVAAGLALRAWQ